MKNVIIIDIDTSRDVPIQVGKPEGFKQGESKEELSKQIIEDMATLCEGICTLIHVADQQGLKPSADSLRDCIKHLESGFADSSYIGKFPEDKK